MVRADDPEIKKAKDRQRVSALRARGRSANIVAPREDQLGTAPVTRQRATRLGGTA